MHSPPTQPVRLAGPILCVSAPPQAPFAAHLAVNLAVYLRALREDVGVLYIPLARRPPGGELLDLPGAPGAPASLESAVALGSLNRAIALGQFGVHAVRAPAAPERVAAEVARDADALRGVLDRTRWGGLHVVDARSGLDALDAAAERAGDRIALPVWDDASLARAVERLERIERETPAARARRRARLLVCGVDRAARVDAAGLDALAQLRAAIARGGWPAYRGFVARAPALEARLGRDGAVRSALHAARGTSLDRQLRALAQEIAVDLGLDALARRERAAREQRLALAIRARGDAPSTEGADAWRRLLRARRPARAPSHGEVARSAGARAFHAPRGSE